MAGIETDPEIGRINFAENFFVVFDEFKIVVDVILQADTDSILLSVRHYLAQHLDNGGHSTLRVTRCARE